MHPTLLLQTQSLSSTIHHIVYCNRLPSAYPLLSYSIYIDTHHVAAEHLLYLSIIAPQDAEINLRSNPAQESDLLSCKMRAKRNLTHMPSLEAQLRFKVHNNELTSQI
jgi:hypothetical protein